jgi:hypothetical protein
VAALALPPSGTPWRPAPCTWLTSTTLATCLALWGRKKAVPSVSR